MRVRFFPLPISLPNSILGFIPYFRIDDPGVAATQSIAWPPAHGPGLPRLFISFLALGDEQTRYLIVSSVCVRAQVVGDEDFS